MTRLSSIVPVFATGVLALTGCGADTGASDPSTAPITASPEAASPASHAPVSAESARGAAEPDDGTEENAMATMVLDSVSVDIILEDNATVQELAGLSPIKLAADDYGRKEKVGELPFAPTARQDLTPTQVNKGEVYLYGSNSLVIFYVSEPDQWGGYTPIGVLQDPDILDAFIGSGETAVTIDFD